MDTLNSSINIATLALWVIIPLAVILSVFTLGRYLFGVGSPLKMNALGRIEAAQKPEDVLREQRRYNLGRWAAFFICVGFVWMILNINAHEKMDVAVTSFVDAVALTVQNTQENANSLLQTLGIGNQDCCDCSQAACIRRYGP